MVITSVDITTSGGVWEAMTEPLIPDTADPIAIGIAKKRQELLTLRRDLEKQIRAIDRSIALLAQALKVFDDSSRLHLAAQNLKPKRFPKTRRFVLDIMREAKKPLTRRQISDAWMAGDGVEDSGANRRLYHGRIGSCLQNCKAQGIVACERGENGEAYWTLTPNA